nr:hypothetical protein [Tanacetum cinerariifolium]
EDETAVTPPPPRHHGARISVRPQTPMNASTHALIDAIAAGSSLFPLPPTIPAYDQAQLGRRAAMIRMRDDILKEDMSPRRRFVFIAPPPGCDVAESSAAATRAPRSQYNFVDTVEARHEDIGYVRALQASEQRMMTSIEEVNLSTDRRDIRLEIDVVRGQMTAYETELQEVHQAYLSFDARNRALLARLETLETYMSRIKWQRQSTEDLAVTQMMRIHTLEARSHIDTNHACNKTRNKRCHDSRIHSSYDRAIQRKSTHTQDDASQSSGGGLRRPVQPARIYSYTNFIKCQPLNFKGTEGIVGLSQWLKKME